MNRFANKSEVMLELERGGHIVSHDLYQWLVKADGETAKIRYSLWRILTKGNGLIKQIRTEIRPPNRIRYYIYEHNRTGKQSKASARGSNRAILCTTHMD